MDEKKSLLIAGIVILTFSMAANAAPGQIDDCQTFSEQVTQLVDETFKSRSVMDGSEVKKLEIQYPHIERSRLQMYMSSAAINWVFNNGNRAKAFEKTIDNCRKYR